MPTAQQVDQYSAEECKSWIVVDGPGIEYLDQMCRPCPGDRCDDVCRGCLRKVVKACQEPGPIAWPDGLGWWSRAV